MTQIKNIPLVTSCASTDTVVGDVGGVTKRIRVDALSNASAASGTFNYAVAYAIGTLGYVANNLEVNISWFYGSVVGGDYSLAYNAAHAFVSAFTSGGTIVFPPNFNAAFKTVITLDASKVRLRGAGAVLDFSTLTGAVYALTLTAGTIGSDPADRFYPAAATRHIDGLIFWGPGKAGSGAGYASTVGCISNNVPYTGMSNCEIYGFGVGVDIYSSGYIQKYHNVNFGQNGTCVQVRSGGTTYGERIVFDTCVLCNSALAISNNCPTGSLQFVNSSIDYNTKALTATNSSVTEFHQCWLEANDAGASNVMASLASGAQLTMIGGRIQGNGSVGAFAQAGWISTSSDARAVFDNVFIFNQQNTANVFDSGSGVVEFTKTRSYSVCYLPATISASNNNRLADGGFVNATVSDYWSLYLDSGTITTRFAAAGSSLALSATFAHAGTQSLKWSKTASGVNGDFVLAVPVPPGSRVAYTGWLKKPAGASAGNVFISTCAARIEGVGSNGVPNMTINTVFDTSSFGGTVALIDWTKQATGMDRVMPQWATHFVIYFSGNGFAGDLYMDDFNISVM